MNERCIFKISSLRLLWCRLKFPSGHVRSLKSVRPRVTPQPPAPRRASPPAPSHAPLLFAATGELYNPIKQDVKNGTLREYYYGAVCYNPIKQDGELYNRMASWIPLLQEI